MKTPRWIEQPRMLAVLTLAFALVPATFAFITFKAARERDSKLFDTAAEVLGEQFKLSTFRHLTFLNVLRSQWRSLGNKSQPPRSVMPPAGWQERYPHLLAVAYASHDAEENIPILWQEGRTEVDPTGTNLAADPALNAVLEKARLSSSVAAFAAMPSAHHLAIVEAVPDASNLRIIRGYMIGWIDLNSICSDQALPLIRDGALKADLDGAKGRRFEISGESDVKWTAWIARGPQFKREYGTPTPWVGFAALGLSVLPLGLLVMLASRAGKLRAALEAEQMKNQFVSSVSHEFRTPLSVILSGAELLETHAASLSEARRTELFAQIKSSVIRMNEMVEQVLLLGRIESGTMQANPQPVDVAALCRDIVEEVQIATQRRCEIEMKLTAALRDLDATLIRSVLVNLLTNAIKYSKPGGRIVFEANENGFFVNDEGIGIPAVDQARLGEPFHRASNVGDISGTGLGLAVVKRSVELCGGEFSLHSQEGEGTQVSIFLRS